MLRLSKVLFRLLVNLDKVTWRFSSLSNFAKPSVSQTLRETTKCYWGFEGLWRAMLRKNYIIFYSKEDASVTLKNEAFVPSMGFDLFSLYIAQAQENISVDSAGVHLMGQRSFLPRGSSGSQVSATRVRPRLEAPGLIPPSPAPGESLLFGHART